MKGIVVVILAVSVILIYTSPVASKSVRVTTPKAITTTEEGDEEKVIWEVIHDDEMPTTTTEDSELEDRFLIGAPSFCPSGQQKTPSGKCKTII